MTAMVVLTIPAAGYRLHVHVEVRAGDARARIELKRPVQQRAEVAR